jgi:hypothetical protein
MQLHYTIEIGHSCRPCHIYVEVSKFHSIIGGFNRLYEIFSVSKKKLVLMNFIIMFFGLTYETCERADRLYQ